ncbi:hypothetical protein [Streptomyces sp. NPDC056661]
MKLFQELNLGVVFNARAIKETIAFALRAGRPAAGTAEDFGPEPIPV